MTALRIYAQMADNVYNVPDSAKLKVGLPKDWSVWGECIYWSGQARGGVDDGGLLGSGFKGCIYKSSDEMVVCFKGTGGGHLLQDLLADAKLAVGIIPREATPASDLVKKALTLYPLDKITVVGHSLGGGLTQVVAYWYKCKFVTFNAPPMLGCIQKSKINLFAPDEMIRSIKSRNNKAGGTNYRLKLDVVSSRKTSAFGHYGPVTTFKAPGVSDPLTAHKMGVFSDYLKRSSDGSINPFE